MSFSIADIAQFELRRAIESDAPQISQLITQVAQQFITNEFSAKARNKMLNSMDKQTILENLQGDFHYYLATLPSLSSPVNLTLVNVRIQSRIVGLIGMRAQSHLFHLFVAPDYHHCGIAKTLWRHALEQVTKSNPTLSLITVNASRFAIAYYKKMGFVQTDSRKEYEGVFYYPMSYQI